MAPFADVCAQGSYDTMGILFACVLTLPTEGGYTVQLLCCQTTAQRPMMSPGITIALIFYYKIIIIQKAAFCIHSGYLCVMLQFV